VTVIRWYVADHVALIIECEEFINGSRCNESDFCTQEEKDALFDSCGADFNCD